ncbi:hypothetical protein TVAG_538680 [Trichomonas vaginalis G3]|uniref:Uncharacterized protein n=1 Tax=Trichomonas vaginalis (strain ATCC PRA-98 / G3) TaxID=412133 RepID=A2GZK1_TRIV3|nr:hypothetical protein TVAG_538680 [Trichomonas vaginalis G3]|eukprot:XP_001290347.1 hypothetical protein [Trichomonas vaginalis G3]
MMVTLFTVKKLGCKDGTMITIIRPSSIFKSPLNISTFAEISRAEISVPDGAIPEEFIYSRSISKLRTVALRASVHHLAVLTLYETGNVYFTTQP